MNTFLKASFVFGIAEHVTALKCENESLNANANAPSDGLRTKKHRRDSIFVPTPNHLLMEIHDLPPPYDVVNGIQMNGKYGTVIDQDYHVPANLAEFEGPWFLVELALPKGDGTFQVAAVPRSHLKQVAWVSRRVVVRQGDRARVKYMVDGGTDIEVEITANATEDEVQVNTMPSSEQIYEWASDMWLREFLADFVMYDVVVVGFKGKLEDPDDQTVQTALDEMSTEKDADIQAVIKNEGDSRDDKKLQYKFVCRLFEKLQLTQENRFSEIIFF